MASCILWTLSICNKSHVVFYHKVNNQSNLNISTTCPRWSTHNVGLDYLHSVFEACNPNVERTGSQGFLVSNACTVFAGLVCNM